MTTAAADLLRTESLWSGTRIDCTALIIVTCRQTVDENTLSYSLLEGRQDLAVVVVTDHLLG